MEQHKHTGHVWDGRTEICSCGVKASDRKDANGRYYVAFAQWPEDAE